MVRRVLGLALIWVVGVCSLRECSLSCLGDGFFLAFGCLCSCGTVLQASWSVFCFVVLCKVFDEFCFVVLCKVFDEFCFVVLCKVFLS
jgi:hypothetical protein